MIDRSTFFAGIRHVPFPGKLSQGQVDGCNAIIDAWERRGLEDARWLAYMLGTVFWETARTMQPVREVGRGRGRAYGRPDKETGQVYYGRGFVQLTWRANYAKMGGLIGVDLVHDPDRALELPVATNILFEGMIRGTFTGRKLADYFSARETDWMNARRIINGTDHAATIAGTAKQFYADIAAACLPAAVA